MASRSQGGDSSVFEKGAGILQNAKHGAGSVAGNRTSGSAWPQLVLNGGGNVYDIIPSRGASRVIALDTMPTAANAVSLVFGFNLGAPVENQVPNVGNLSRDFAARVEFGTGNANFAVECDVLVGSRVSVAGDSVEVMMLDYTIQAQDPSAAYWGLVNAAAASYLPGLHGYKTDRCLLPCQYAAAAGLADTLGNLQQCLVDLEGP